MATTNNQRSDALIQPDPNRPGMDNIAANMFPFLVMVLPYVLIGFFVLLSVFNENLKGIMYITGIVMLISFTSIFIQDSPRENISGRKEVCRLFDLYGFSKSLPFSIMVYSFTFIYLILPMYIFEHINYQVIILLMFSIVLDTFYRTRYSCDSMRYILTAGIVGTIVGFVWFSLVYAVNHDLLYHTELVSNKLSCSLKSEQRYSCEVEQIS